MDPGDGGTIVSGTDRQLRAGIPEVSWGRLERHEDERGAFRELFRASWSPQRYVQANLSTSRAGVLRGVHVHRHQADRWTVLSGRIFVAVVDLRPFLGWHPNAAATVEASALGSVDVETRALGPDEWVLIPAGVAHGFHACEDTTLHYLVTNEFDGTDEHGFAWDDPDAGIPWPSREPVLSARDRSNPSLRELLRSIRD
jgi:dTDP-4-dehydrorhamnose 3,5-epimerase